MSKFLICLLAAAICLCGGCLSPAKNQLHLAPVAAQPNADEPVVRVLVLGKDRAAGLTDSIFIVTLRTRSRVMSVLQLPRDTYAEYTDRDYKKLNGAYASLGLSGTKQFLSQALGVPIDYAVAVDLDCVSELVDAVGGVEVEVTRPMHYRDPSQDLTIELEPGIHLLDGVRAEQFLRFRSGYVNADLGRMDAQKRFIAAFVEKCGEIEVMSLGSLIWRAFPHAETDAPIHKVIELARLVPQCNAEDLPMLTAPGEAVQGVSGAWYYCLNREGMIGAIREYLMPTDYTEERFDPAHVFDREENPDFHNIYIAPKRG